MKPSDRGQSSNRLVGDSPPSSTRSLPLRIALVEQHEELLGEGDGVGEQATAPHQHLP
jgi:hypothetical protein